ncbi:DUF3261 domain-containing protein [Lysobacter olei]
MRRLIALAMLCLALLGCASAPPRASVRVPLLALAPSALGHELAVQQRLHFAFGAQQRDLEALLEVDAREVRLAVQALGQAGVRLSWDGTTLQQQRAPWLPPQVRGDRVLSDLQFTLWPTDAIRAALPAPWTLETTTGERRLVRDGRVWLLMLDQGAGRYRLDNLAEGYTLQVETAGGEAAP